MEEFNGNFSLDEREKELLLRLKKIEGQVRGIQKMVDEKRYCVDILNQIAAVKAALNKVGLNILEKHTHGCVRKAIESGEGDPIIDELMGVIKKFVK